MALEQICQGMKLSAIPWLKSSMNIDISVTFRCIMYWIYVDIINVVLRNCFYITEGEGYGNEVLRWVFFRA